MKPSRPRLLHALLLATGAAGGCNWFAPSKANQRSGELVKPATTAAPATASSASPFSPAASPGSPGSDAATPATSADSGPMMPPQVESTLDTAHSVVDYAKLCKAELGMPAAVQKPWNCLDGSEIPITVNGQSLNPTNYLALANSGGGCDKPSWLGDNPCTNYAFVQRRELAANVTAMLLCRQRQFTGWQDLSARRAAFDAQPSFDNFRQLYDFDSLGLIWTNTKTGKTCFFDFVGRVYGGYVASPDDDALPELTDLPTPKPPPLPPPLRSEQVWRKNALSTWKQPGSVAAKDNCILCHDSGPFKTSPYLAQVLKIAPPDAHLPYQLVGQVMEPWRRRFPLAAISTSKVNSPAGPVDQLCTSCHRIGNQATCDQQISYAIGKTATATLSAHGSAFFSRMWMPPLGAEILAAWQGKTESQLNELWTKLYGAHVDKLRCCCRNPQARGCFQQDITKNPLPPPSEGLGPGNCR